MQEEKLRWQQSILEGIDDDDSDEEEEEDCKNNRFHDKKIKTFKRNALQSIKDKSEIFKIQPGKDIML